MVNLLVYHVDIGRWITCDFSMFNETVSEIKLQIKKKTDIPVNNQVLLVRGGCDLDPSKALSCYCAGTDTNPFFLFSRRLIYDPEPPLAYINIEPDLDFTCKHRSTQEMPPTIGALNVRVSLSQEYYENAQYILNCTKILINDHYMMHQGWLAAVANMLGTLDKFDYKANIFKNNFKRYLAGKDDSIKLLNNFDNILKEISNIPMLPALLENNFEEQAQMNGSEANKKNIVHQSLLEWVTARQGLTYFEYIVKYCNNSIKKFDEEMLNFVLQEVSATKEHSSRSDCSEIEGLEHRLSKLAQMMDESKHLTNEQFNIAEAIKMNNLKPANKGDESVISVLIASHDKQLAIMNKNNVRLCDIRNRSIKSKQELCNIFHPRLKWLIVVENKVSDVEATMLLHSDNIKLTREYLDVIEQLHNTPKLYFNAVAEVVRRRIFSQALLIWSSDLACQMMARHSDEIAKRKHFQSQFEGHFLSSLFPGLEDMPPPFATQAPPIFDYNLPKLCLDDLDVLIKQLPQIAREISVPNFNAITQFFLSKSIQEDDTLAIEYKNEHKSLANNKTNKISEDMETIDEKFNEVVITVGLGSCKINMQQESDVNKRTHSEMENDIYNPDSFILPHKYTGSQQEQNVQLLKNSLYNLENLSNISVNAFRKDLELIKQYILQQNVEINMFTNDLKTKYDTLTYHLQQVFQFIEVNNRELKAMKTRINELETLLEICINSEEHERQLRFRLENEKDEFFQRELELARKEITNQLKLTHKAEIEMIKTRYKLVSQKSSTECSSSSSEQSLEKFKQRCDVNELVNHETIIAQIKEDLLLQKEQALQDEQKLFEQRLAYEQKLKYEDYKNDYCILDDSKRSIDDEIRPLKHLKEKSVSDLRLSSYSQLSRSNSILVAECDINSSSTSNSVSLDLTKSSNSESDEVKLSVTSCNAGDFVLVVWDSIYKNYIVYQDKKINLVFLHPDSIDHLSLKLSSDEIPKLQYFSAEVIEKEYCEAVKEDNRYRVKKGMKFYRAKIQLLKIPIPKRDTSISDCPNVSVTFD